MIAAIVVPVGIRSIAMMRACLVLGRAADPDDAGAGCLRDTGLAVFRAVERDAAFGLDLGLVMGSSEVCAAPAASSAGFTIITSGFEFSAHTGDGDDRYQIELMSEQLECDPDQWDRIEARLRAMTRMLVRRHRERIERVAEALLAEKTLSAKAIDKLAGRSINDVKENEPFLKEMHRRRQSHRRSG
jgi:Spy/CpxP family protein refolding chaperone